MSSNLSAFPFAGIGTLNPSGYEVSPSSGMMLRDYFAAKAMQSAFLVALQDPGSLEEGLRDPDRFARHVADGAYGIADAMLKARGEG